MNLYKIATKNVSLNKFVQKVKQKKTARRHEPIILKNSCQDIFECKENIA